MLFVEPVAYDHPPHLCAGERHTLAAWMCRRLLHIRPVYRGHARAVIDARASKRARRVGFTDAAHSTFQNGGGPMGDRLGSRLGLSLALLAASAPGAVPARNGTIDQLVKSV